MHRSTSTCGVIITRHEVDAPGLTIWVAFGDPDGCLHRGYGKTEADAVVDLLREFEVARLDQPDVMPNAGPSIFDLFAAAPRPAREHKELDGMFWYQLKAGEKIRAIKILREATNLTLRAAKDIVDAIMSKEYVRDDA